MKFYKAVLGDFLSDSYDCCSIKNVGGAFLPIYGYSTNIKTLESALWIKINIYRVFV